jgi:hypothetical protein
VREDDKRKGFPWYLQNSGKPERWNSDIAAFADLRMFNHDTTTSSDPAFQSGQLCRIESQFFAGAAYQARVKDLVGMAEWNFRLSAFSMHRDHDRALMPPIMLAVINAAALLNEPPSKCRAFHTFAPVGCRISYHSRDVILIFNFLPLRTVRVDLVRNR